MSNASSGENMKEINNMQHNYVKENNISQCECIHGELGTVYTVTVMGGVVLGGITMYV